MRAKKSLSFGSPEESITAHKKQKLRAAALLTLQLQRTALAAGFSLKDASAYNIQFREGRPVLIDTLSFERYVEGTPWVAYGQFCRHFLAPLALMSSRDVTLGQLLRVYMDGIPLDIAGKLLPARTLLVPSLLFHIHLHAKTRARPVDGAGQAPAGRMSALSFKALIDSLESGVRRLTWQPRGRIWTDYYKDIHYADEAFEHKKALVADFLGRINPRTLWDLGANTGLFSRMASDKGIFTVSLDGDPTVVEINYLECLQKGEKNLLPLVGDLANPSPSIGWQNRERASLLQRSRKDTVLALALIHHLAIGNNVPLDSLAEFFSGIGVNLIIEFVPKDDPKVRQLLSTRTDIFRNYDREHFEKEFGRHFRIVHSCSIKGSGRILYLMTRNQADE